MRYAPVKARNASKASYIAREEIIMERLGSIDDPGNAIKA
jgi:hypothetical protein